MMMMQQLQPRCSCARSHRQLLFMWRRRRRPAVHQKRRRLVFLFWASSVPLWLVPLLWVLLLTVATTTTTTIVAAAAAVAPGAVSDTDSHDDEDTRIPVYWINLNSRTDRRTRMQESYTNNSPWLKQYVNFHNRVSAFSCQEVYDMLTTASASASMTSSTVTVSKPTREEDTTSIAVGCWSEAHSATYLVGYPAGEDAGTQYQSRAAAQQVCVQYGEKCGGIVSSGVNQWEVREGRIPHHGPAQETSYVKVACPAAAEPTTTGASSTASTTTTNDDEHEFCHYTVNELPSAFQGRGAGTTDPLRIVEIATTMSHILAIACSYHATNEQEYTIILEDDVMLDNVDRVNRFRPVALQHLATKMITLFGNNQNNNNWLVHLYCNNAMLAQEFLLEPPNIIIQPSTMCLGAQMYMLSHTAMQGILAVYVPGLLPILKDHKMMPTTPTSKNQHELMMLMKTRVRDQFGTVLQRDRVDCIAETALYRNVKYFTTTRPFGYQLSGTSNIEVDGIGRTPEALFDAFYASTEARHNEMYQPITDWIGPKQKTIRRPTTL